MIYEALLASINCRLTLPIPIPCIGKRNTIRGFRQYGRRCNSWKHLPFTAKRLSVAEEKSFRCSFLLHHALYIEPSSPFPEQRWSNAASRGKLMTKLWLSPNKSSETIASRNKIIDAVVFRIWAVWCQPQKRSFMGTWHNCKSKKGIVHYSDVGCFVFLRHT